MKRRQRRLPHPVLPKRHHRLEELVAVLGVDHDVVVTEEDLSAARLELGDHLGHRTEAELRPVVGRDTAELARERTASRGLDDVERDVADRLDEIAPRLRKPYQRLVFVVLVDRAPAQGARAPELALPGVAHHVLPDPFGLTAHDRVGVFDCFVRERGDMDSAEHHEAPPSAVRVGDCVRTRRGLRVDADPHEIRRIALAREIDRVEPVVAEGQLDVVRRVRGERRDPERLDVRRVLVRRGNEVDVKRGRHAREYTRSRAAVEVTTTRK